MRENLTRCFAEVVQMLKFSFLLWDVVQVISSGLAEEGFSLARRVFEVWFHYRLFKDE